MHTSTLSLYPRDSRGFTLIEILVVIGMLALLATIVLVAVNPLRQFAQARNTQRQANVSAILNAVGNRLADNRGIFTDTAGSCSTALPTVTTGIAKTGSPHYDLRPCLVPTYLSELPFDPVTGSNTCTTETCDGQSEAYDTQYTIVENSSTHRITVCAPRAAEPALLHSTEFCLTR